MTRPVLTHLAALQLADSSFPAGRYTLSYGLEAFVHAGLVTGPRELEGFLGELLARQVAPTEGIAAAWAWRGAESGELEVALTADRLLDAAKTVESQREASRQAGRRVLDVARAIGLGGPIARYGDEVRAGSVPGHQAAAMALAAHQEGVGLAETVAAELFAVATAVVGAALRLIRIDHLAAQRILHRLRPRLGDLTVEAVGAHLADIGGWAPAAEAAAMAHQSAARRLFAT